MKHAQLIILCIIFLFSCSKSKEKKKIKRVNNIFYTKAQEYDTNRNFYSAFTYFNKAKDLSLLKKDSIGVSKALTYMGIIQTDQGNHFGAQETLVDALRYLNIKNPTHFGDIASIYSTLGVTASNLKRYPKAIEFYQQALSYTNNHTSRSVVEGNMANAYRDNGDYQKALLLYQKSLKQKTINTPPYARLITNIATTKWLQDTNYNPVPQLLKALHIRERENDLWGQNSSYAHLVDYYIKHNNDSANFYADKLYKVTIKINSPDDQLGALTKLVKIAPYKESKQYFEIFERLNDSLQTARSNANNQFAVIRYETEKHKADNLVLQKENTEKKYQIIILTTSAIILLIVGVIWYKKRKQRIELEAQNAIRDNQLHTSKKVHDKVANKIYSVISEIENRRELDKDNLLDKLDHIYHTSRDISYEIMESKQHKKFSQQLSDMLHTYFADPPHVKITGNDEAIWTNISSNSKNEIFIILQELMTNMKKHSQATEVNIKFHKKDNFISVHYHDNGIGLPKNMVHNNGLTNTVTRIKNILGNITFETIENKGLKILISFPIH